MELIHPSVKLRRRLREAICVRCALRPAASEYLPPATPRDCELRCQVFVNLPKLVRIALSVRGTRMAPYERACNELVCQECQASPTHGDFCSERATERCPLALYLRDAVEVIEGMPRRELIAA